MAKETFKTVSIKGHLYSVGTGYVVIPNNVDRSLYIARALRSCKLMMFTENNEVLTNVRVSPKVVQQIEFPETSEELGSAVLFVTIKNKNAPVIISVLLKEEESTFLKEHEFVVDKMTEAGSVRISGNAETGEMTMLVDHDTASKLNLISKGSSGEINLKSGGNISVDSDGTFFVNTEDGFEFKVSNSTTQTTSTIKYTNNSGFEYSDEFGNELTIDATGAVISATKIALGSSTAAEASVLGTSLQIQLTLTQLFLTTLQTAINSAIPIPQDGGTAVLTTLKAAVGALQTGDYSSILSTKTFVE